MGAAETAFVSTATFTQGEFKRWVERRPLADVNRYELINGRIVMTPPAGWGHGEVGARVVRFLGNFVEEHERGRVFDSSTGYELPCGETLEPDASLSQQCTNLLWFALDRTCSPISGPLTTVTLPYSPSE